MIALHLANDDTRTVPRCWRARPLLPDRMTVDLERVTCARCLQLAAADLLVGIVR